MEENKPLTPQATQLYHGPRPKTRADYVHDARMEEIYESMTRIRERGLEQMWRRLNGY